MAAGRTVRVLQRRAGPARTDEHAGAGEAYARAGGDGRQRQGAGEVGSGEALSCATDTGEGGRDCGQGQRTGHDCLVFSAIDEVGCGQTALRNMFQAKIGCGQIRTWARRTGAQAVETTPASTRLLRLRLHRRLLLRDGIRDCKKESGGYCDQLKFLAGSYFYGDYLPSFLTIKAGLRFGGTQPNGLAET